MPSPAEHVRLIESMAFVGAFRADARICVKRSLEMSDADPYRTLQRPGTSELVVERSRFLGYARPVDSVEEGLAFVEELRAEHYDARHHCYGLRVGRGSRTVDRSNDDGEPVRTGGFPLWQLLDGEEVTDAVLAVVRYYGGVKLGTGGLARAYRDCGRVALEDAGIRTVYPEVRLLVEVPYSFVDSLQHLMKGLDVARVEDVSYGADVMFEIAVRRLSLDDVRERLGALLQRDPQSFTADD